VRRMVVIAPSAILAVVVAIRIASGKKTRNLADHLIAAGWKWALQDPALQKPQDSSRIHHPLVIRRV
jgi:hypothetical protein